VSSVHATLGAQSPAQQVTASMLDSTQ